MLKQHNQIRNTFLRLFDVLVALAAWELAYLLRFFWIDLPPAMEIPAHEEYLKASVAVMLITAVVFPMNQVYRTQELLRPGQETIKLIHAATLVFLIALVTAFFYRTFSYSRVHTLYFLGCFVVLLGLERYFVRRLFSWLHAQGAYVDKVLVVGDGSQADEVMKRLHALQPFGILLSGFVPLGDKAAKPKNIPCLGSLRELPEIIHEHRIDQVFISLSLEGENRLEELKDLLSEQWVDVRIVPDMGSFRTLHTDVESLEGMPLVTLVQSPMMGWNRVLKRILDLFGGMLALLIFSPLMALIALLVKLTSRGPVLYRQERMGLDGRTFQALKFRSMHVEAEEETGAVWAREDDTRRTGLGIWLRRFSLDELPQLFNVLGGEMSLVGPRPERPEFVEQLVKEIPHYSQRHLVRPGVTGWAQVNGGRDLSIAEFDAGEIGDASHETVLW